MAMFSSGSFKTSTPIHNEHDSGFYENSPQSRNLSQTSAVENLESSNLLSRKSLFGKRSISENIPNYPFSQRRKLLLSRSSFSRRDPSSNKETPRASRNFVCSGERVNFEETKKTKPHPCWYLESDSTSLKLHDNDSGFCCKTPEILDSPKTESDRVLLLPMIKNLHQGKGNSKEETLAYFKQLLNYSGTENSTELSRSEMLYIYFIYRFQRTGLKPSAADITFYEKQLLVNEESEKFLVSWKDKLERISTEIDMPKKIDFLSQIHKMNAYSLVSTILSYLSGYDLQIASCVSRLWRKLVLEDKHASRKISAYLNEKEKLKMEMEKKKTNPFQRPPNFRILGCSENIQKEQLQFQNTIKEINFDAFIEVGKSGRKHKPKKCPSCANLSLQNKRLITKYTCLFCGYEFCFNCLKPYTNWHTCNSINLPVKIPPTNSKRYLRRL